MTDMIKTYLTKIHLGAEQSFKNLSIFPLLSDYFIPFDYLTIDDAISKDLVEMMEIKENGSTHKDNQYHGRDHVNALRDYLEHFARVDSQIGVLFMINGKVAGMECFGRSEVLKARFMKMIESYAETAIDRFDPKINLRSSKAEAINFLQMAKESRGIHK